MTKNINNNILRFRNIIEKRYNGFSPFGGSFGEIICFELHDQPINPRMETKTITGYNTGLTFKELAQKWGISVSFLGELIADHCKRLE